MGNSQDSSPASESGHTSETSSAEQSPLRRTSEITDDSVNSNNSGNSGNYSPIGKRKRKNSVTNVRTRLGSLKGITPATSQVPRRKEAVRIQQNAVSRVRVNPAGNTRHRIPRLKKEDVSKLKEMITLEEVLDTLTDAEMKTFKNHFLALLNKTEVLEVNISNRALTDINFDIMDALECEKIDASHNGISDLSPGIGNMLFLEILNLEDNQITSLPREIGKLRRMRELRLAHNRLFCYPLPPEIGQLKTLHTLDLCGNSLEDLRPEFGNLNNLTYLNISKNSLRTIPPYCAKLSKLQTLLAGKNKLTNLPQNFGEISELRILDLSDNMIKRLPESLGAITTLNVINLSMNLVQALPSSFGSVRTSLEELFLSDNPRLETLPDLYFFPKLKKLHLQSTVMLMEQPYLGSLAYLEELNFRDNKHVKKLSAKAFGFLISLRRLDMSGLNLVTIPSSFGNLINLTLIDLHGNKLSNFPTEFQYLQELNKLNLSDNDFISIDPLIHLTKLKSLKISRNKISEIPEDFFMITTLRELVISKNRILRIPPGIGELKNLEILEISNNYLTDLPEEMGNLVKLKKLILNDNFLKMLPWELGCLKGTLNVLNIDGNPDLAFPPQALEMGILKWLNKNRKEGKKLEYKYVKKMEKLEKEKEKEKTEIPSTSQSKVVWSCLVKKQWIPYDDTISKELEMSYSRGDTSHILTQSLGTSLNATNPPTTVAYTILFGKMKQVNNQSGFMRDIRRDRFFEMKKLNLKFDKGVKSESPKKEREKISPPKNEDINWEFSNREGSVWTRYDKASQIEIEKGWQGGLTRVVLSHAFFARESVVVVLRDGNFRQVNEASGGFVRDVRRVSPDGIKTGQKPDKKNRPTFWGIGQIPVPTPPTLEEEDKDPETPRSRMFSLSHQRNQISAPSTPRGLIRKPMMPAGEEEGGVPVNTPRGLTHKPMMGEEEWGVPVNTKEETGPSSRPTSPVPLTLRRVHRLSVKPSSNELRELCLAVAEGLPRHLWKRDTIQSINVFLASMDGYAPLEELRPRNREYSMSSKQNTPMYPKVSDPIPLVKIPTRSTLMTVESEPDYPTQEFTCPKQGLKMSDNTCPGTESMLKLDSTCPGTDSMLKLDNTCPGNDHTSPGTDNTYPGTDITYPVTDSKLDSTCSVTDHTCSDNGKPLALSQEDNVTTDSDEENTAEEIDVESDEEEEDGMEEEGQTSEQELELEPEPEPALGPEPVNQPVIPDDVWSSLVG